MYDHSLDHLVGKKIRLIEMLDDPDPIPPGTTGTVETVTYLDFDKTHQITVKWDCNRSLSLIVPPDKFEVLPYTIPQPCLCGSGKPRFLLLDARGIHCAKKVKEKLRQDVLNNPKYVANEPIEPEE